MPVDSAPSEVGVDPLVSDDNVASPVLCSKCGASVEIDARFCQSCATPVKTGPKKCNGCGKLVDPTARYCKFCATELTEPTGFSLYRANDENTSSNFDSGRREAERLAVVGGGGALISGVAFLWGLTYTNNLANKAAAGFGALVGQTDSTYSLAQAFVVLGAIGFIIGVVVCIYALNLRSNGK